MSNRQRTDIAEGTTGMVAECAANVGIQRKGKASKKPAGWGQRMADVFLQVEPHSEYRDITAVQRLTLALRNSKS